MPFNNDADNAYLDQQLKTALDNWDPDRTVPLGFKPRIWGCKPESQKFPSKNIIREILECFAIRYGLSCMFWQLNRAVWGLATLLPEINCFATTRANTGYVGQTEKTGIPA